MAHKNRIELNDFDDILNDERYKAANTDKEEREEIEEEKVKEKKKGRKNKFIDEYDDEEFIQRNTKSVRSFKQKAAIIIPVVSGALILFLIMTAVIINASLNNGKIYAGIYFNNYSLHGMTKNQVEEYITEKYINPFKNKSVSISYDDKTITTSLYELAKTPDAGKFAQEAYSVARNGNAFSRLLKLMRLKSRPVKLAFELGIDEEKLQEAADTLNGQVHVDYENPTYKILPNSVTFTGGKNGLSIDKDKLKNEIITALFDLLESKNGNSAIEITAEIQTEKFTPLSETEIFNKVYSAPVNATYSKISRSEIVITDSVSGRSLDADKLRALVNRINSGEKIIYEELPILDVEAEFTRSLLENTLMTYTISSASSKNTSDDDVTDITRMQEREINIQKCVETLNGLILLPGEVFDFWAELGDFSENAGYVMAYDNSSGANDKVLGGGLSQVASAIYLAAFNANLDITQQYNYPYTVNYGPLGFDAHVVKNSKNLMFTNSLEFPVRLELIFENDTLNVKVIGTDDESGKRIQAHVTSLPISYKTKYIDDPTVDQGTVILNQSGIVGYEVSLYKKWLSGGVELISEFIKTVTYQSRDEIYIRGTKPVD